MPLKKGLMGKFLLAAILSVGLLLGSSHTTHAALVPCADADIDQDGAVSILDFYYVLDDYGKLTVNAEHPRSDIDHDGRVSILDLSQFFAWVYKRC